MHKMMSAIVLCLLCLCTLVPALADKTYAADIKPCLAGDSECTDRVSEKITRLPSVTVEGEPPSFLDYDQIVGWLDAPSAMISSGLSIFARNVDEFFAAEKLDYMSSGSYLRLTTDAAWYEQEPSGFAANLRLRLHLPRTKEKYKFTLDSSPDSTKDDLDTTVEADLVNAADSQSYFAGIQAIFGRMDRWRFRTGFGVKLRAPPDSYIRLGTWRDFIVNQWGIHVQGTAFWFRHDGRVLNSTIELSHPLSEVLLFRSISHTHWTELNRYIEASQVFSLYKSLNKDRQISVQAGVYGDTEPLLHATDYRVAFGARKYLRKRYLYVELIPQLRYQKIHHFVAERGLILRLEWVFHG